MSDEIGLRHNKKAQTRSKADFQPPLYFFVHCLPLPLIPFLRFGPRHCDPHCYNPFYIFIRIVCSLCRLITRYQSEQMCTSGTVDIISIPKHCYCKLTRVCATRSFILILISKINNYTKLAGTSLRRICTSAIRSVRTEQVPPLYLQSAASKFT